MSKAHQKHPPHIHISCGKWAFHTFCSLLIPLEHPLLWQLQRGSVAWTTLNPTPGNLCALRGLYGTCRNWNSHWIPKQTNQYSLQKTSTDLNWLKNTTLRKEKSFWAHLLFKSTFQKGLVLQRESPASNSVAQVKTIIFQKLFTITSFPSHSEGLGVHKRSPCADLSVGSTSDVKVWCRCITCAERNICLAASPGSLSVQLFHQDSFNREIYLHLHENCTE